MTVRLPSAACHAPYAGREVFGGEVRPQGFAHLPRMAGDPTLVILELGEEHAALELGVELLRMVGMVVVTGPSILSSWAALRPLLSLLTVRCTALPPEIRGRSSSTSWSMASASFR